MWDSNSHLLREGIFMSKALIAQGTFWRKTDVYQSIVFHSEHLMWFSTFPTSSDSYYFPASGLGLKNARQPKPHLQMIDEQGPK